MQAEPHAVLALALPEAYFPDGDDICRKAGTHIARTLGEHLEASGHSVPEWVRGGCEEDAWVYLESELNGVRYEYVIVFFPRETGREDASRWMAVQYGIKVSLWKRLMSGSPKLTVEDPIHAALREFGATHERFQLLTERQFREEY